MLEIMNEIKKSIESSTVLDNHPKTTFYAPANEYEIVKFAQKRGYTPDDYEDLLRIHNGVRNIWGNFHFIGSNGFDDVESFILEVTHEATSFAEKIYNINANDVHEIRNWEVRTVQYYLPHYLVFGADLDSKILFFNQYNRTTDGKEEVIVWDKYEGAVGSYSSFTDFLQHINETIK